MASSITNRLLRFARATRATASMEFVIVFPIIMIMFIAVFESSMILIRQVMLERALDNTVRVLRLTNDATVTDEQIRDNICENTVVINNCNDILVVDLRIVDQVNYALPTADSLCVDRDGVVNPANQFVPGAENELMLIRVCAEVQRIIPLSGWGLNLTRDNNGSVHMTSASVFVNEPD
ncbi:pilus assembly protein [Rhodobacterales bacterium HKCCE3408]|nr:pilus assembly protein [Rhodobacterales bacterium HKCCE3408]